MMLAASALGVVAAAAIAQDQDRPESLLPPGFDQPAPAPGGFPLDTGKAATRLSESIAQARDALDVQDEVKTALEPQASTIHRALGTRPGAAHRFRHDHATPLAVVYGNDLVRGADLPTAVSISADIITELGYFVPPGAVHLYLDDYWKALGSDLGTLRYCPELVIEHLHPTAGTAPSDAGYLEVNRPELYRQDEQTYHRHMATRHPADIDRLRELRRAL